MKLITTAILTILITWVSVAQNSMTPSSIELNFSPEFIDFSPDDRYMIAENENQYVVWNMDTQTKVLEGEYSFKIGRFAKGFSIPNGSGYFLFGKEEVFITVDYQQNSTELKAFSLKNGDKLWESEDLDMGVSIAETIISAHSGSTMDLEVNGTRLSKRHTANNFFTKDRFLDRLIHYIPEKNAIAMNGKNGLQLVDIRNGQILWTQNEFKGGIGEVIIDVPKNKLYAVTVPLSDGALDELTTTPRVIAFQINTGELLWSVDYTGTFVPNYASLVGNTLVLPYLELTLIDTQSGVERDGDIKNRVASIRKVSKGLGGLMAIDKAMGGSFGQQDNNSKYNRLVPRQLHFNENEKLCYFTTFNKDGEWGKGQKKGFMVIDIHKDAIAFEKYGVLGNQWTVLQDEMDDGVFYIKARGNLNRSIIKAIDAKNGNELFETEKAKNSADISKAFNPFMINENHIIDIVSKGVYVFDKKTGEKISYQSTRDLGVGTIKFSEFYENGLLLFGTRGLGIMNFNGAIINSISSRNIKGFAASSKEIWLLENKEFKRIDASNGEVLETLSHKNKENIAFSQSGKVFVKYSKNKIEVFQY